VGWKEDCQAELVEASMNRGTDDETLVQIRATLRRAQGDKRNDEQRQTVQVSDTTMLIKVLLLAT
jgi:c-di-GMP-binding flagellar brake protein YcgR